MLNAYAYHRPLLASEYEKKKKENRLWKKKREREREKKTVEISGGIPARWLPLLRSIPSEFLPPWRTFFRLFCRRGGPRDGDGDGDDCDGGNFFSILSSGPFDLHESHAKTLRSLVGMKDDIFLEYPTISHFLQVTPLLSR